MPHVFRNDQRHTLRHAPQMSAPNAAYRSLHGTPVPHSVHRFAEAESAAVTREDSTRRFVGSLAPVEVAGVMARDLDPARRTSRLSSSVSGIKPPM